MRDQLFRESLQSSATMKTKNIKTFTLDQLIKLDKLKKVIDFTNYDGVKIYLITQKKQLKTIWNILESKIPKKGSFTVYFAYDIKEEEAGGRLRTNNNKDEYDKFMTEKSKTSNFKAAMINEIGVKKLTNDKMHFGICPHNTFCTSSKEITQKFLHSIPDQAKILIELDIAGLVGHTNCSMSHIFDCGWSQQEVVETITTLAQKSEVVVLFDFKGNNLRKPISLLNKDRNHHCILEYENAFANNDNIFKKTDSKIDSSKEPT